MEHFGGTIVFMPVGKILQKFHKMHKQLNKTFLK